MSEDRQKKYEVKGMLELEWQERRAAVLDDMDTRDNSMVDTLAEQLRLMDIWMDDMATIIYNASH